VLVSEDALSRAAIRSETRRSSSTGNVKDRIWRELMQLYAIDKEKPAKEFMGRER
jgi:hypothetical protein